MNHATIELLLADYRGLRGAEREEVDAHVASCPDCAARLADYRAMDMGLQGLRNSHPGPALRAGYEAAVRDERAGVRTRPAHGRSAPWLYGFAAAAAVLVLVVAVWSIFRPNNLGTGLPRGQGSIPAAKSAEVGSLIWQTDGVYGYQMLRPADWNATDQSGARLFGMPDSAQGADGVAISVLKAAQAERAPTESGTPSIILGLFRKNPTFEGWIAGIEQATTSAGGTVTVVRSLPAARIYLTLDAPEGLAPMLMLSAYKVDNGRPLVIVLLATGAYATLDRLEAAGIVDDFATMVESARAIPLDPGNVAPPLWQAAAAAVSPVPFGSPAPTAEPQAMATAGAATVVNVTAAGDLLPPANGLAHTWRDYETALVRAILPATLANGVCDWRVLGHTEREVYVWALCAANQPETDIAAASLPAVLALADDGHTVTARIPRDGTYYPEDVRLLFPADVQEQIFRHLPEATLSRLEQHARRRLTLPTLPPLGAAEIIPPRPDVSAAGAHIDLYSGRADNPRWDLNELDLAQLGALLEGLPPQLDLVQLGALLEGLPAVECPPMPGQLGYRGVVVGLGMADESRMTAYGGTLWFGYPGANPQATCLADPDRAVERFLLGSAQPYVDPQVFGSLTAGLALPVPTPLATPAPTPTLAQGFVLDADESFGVQFTRPANWEQCQATGLSRLYCVAGPPTENPVAPPAFYFTLLPPGFMNEDASAYNWWAPDELAAAFAAAVGEQFISTRTPAGYEQYHTYARLADVKVDGFSAIVVENERPWGIATGTKDRRVLVRLGQSTFVLGSYYGTAAELRDFEEVTASFKLGTLMRATAGGMLATPPAPTR